MIDERVYGKLLQYGAEFSLIRYTWKGILFEEWVENNDFIFREDIDD